MEKDSTSSSSDKPRYGREHYIELTFKLSRNDDELLARLWEAEPEIMSRLMPEIGNESEEEIAAEMSRWQGYTYLALNSLRITLGREPKLTPRQRMREALINLQEQASNKCTYPMCSYLLHDCPAHRTAR